MSDRIQHGYDARRDGRLEGSPAELMALQITSNLLEIAKAQLAALQGIDQSLQVIAEMARDWRTPR